VEGLVNGTTESLAHAENAWKVRPTDVLINTAPKSGTTLLTQICHMLRTGGSPPPYEDVHQVAPYVPLAFDLGQDLNADQVAEPRLFKLHTRPSLLAERARMIIGVREPVAMCISFYNYEVAMFGRDVIGSPEEFVMHTMTDAPFHLMREGFELRSELGVLFLPYEFLVKHRKDCVRAIASLMGIEPLTSELLQSVLHHSSRTYMLENKEQFANGWTFRTLEARNRKHAYSYKGFFPKPAPKVTLGLSAEQVDASLSPEVQQAVRNRWWELCGKHIGCRTYADMLALIDMQAT